MFQKKGRTLTFGLMRGLGGSTDAGPKPMPGGGGIPPPGGGGGGMGNPGGGGGGTTESGDDKGEGTPVTLPEGERGFTPGGSGVPGEFGWGTDCIVGVVVIDCEVMAAVLSDTVSKLATKK